MSETRCHGKIVGGLQPKMKIEYVELINGFLRSKHGSNYSEGAPVARN